MATQDFKSCSPCGSMWCCLEIMQELCNSQFPRLLFLNCRMDALFQHSILKKQPQRLRNYRTACRKWKTVIIGTIFDWLIYLRMLRAAMQSNLYNANSRFGFPLYTAEGWSKLRVLTVFTVVRRLRQRDEEPSYSWFWGTTIDRSSWRPTHKQAPRFYMASLSSCFSLNTLARPFNGGQLPRPALLHSSRKACSTFFILLALKVLYNNGTHVSSSHEDAQSFLDNMWSYPLTPTNLYNFLFEHIIWVNYILFLGMYMVLITPLKG